MKNKESISLVWSAVESLSKLCVQLIIGIILARLLTPYDYGIIGILTVFITISQVLINCGYCEALLRSNACNYDAYNSVFIINLIIGISIYIILFFTSGIIASYFNIEDLAGISRVLFIIIPLKALNIVQTTILNKTLNFKSLAKYSLLSSIISGTMGIYMAHRGYGAWSLVAQAITAEILYTCVIWLKATWTPKLSLSKDFIVDNLDFSLKLTFIGIINTLFNNLYTLVIGKLYDKTTLGYYTQSIKYGSLIPNQLQTIFNRVAFPVFTLKDDNSANKKFNSYVSLALSIVMPVQVLIIFNAEKIVSILLGEQWLPASNFLIVTAIMCISFPFHGLCITFLKSKGAANIILFIELIKKFLLIAGIVISYKYGIKYILYSQLGFYYIALIMNYIFAKRTAGASIYDDLKSILIILLFNAISLLLCMVLMKVYYAPNDSIYLMLYATTYLGIYAILMYKRTKITINI